MRTIINSGGGSAHAHEAAALDERSTNFACSHFIPAAVELKNCTQSVGNHVDHSYVEYECVTSTTGL